MKKLFHFLALLLLFSPRVAWARHSIVVNKWNNTLNYYETGKPLRQFSVATGLYRCTPEGRFRIIQKSFISRSGRGQFGTRWMGLNTLGKRGWYHIGIHGTNEPESIGKYASKACVRMRNTDINWLFERVPYGATVRIVDVPIKPKPRAANPADFSHQVAWLQRTRPPLKTLTNRRLADPTHAFIFSGLAPGSHAATTRFAAFPTGNKQTPLLAVLNSKRSVRPISYSYSYTKS